MTICKQKKDINLMDLHHEYDFTGKHNKMSRLAVSTCAVKD